MYDTLFKDKEFYESTFSNIDSPSIQIEDRAFEGCIFNQSNFSESNFIRCKFISCEFNNCNLSTAQFDGSTFNEVVFEESKISGINWTKLNWSHIRLHSPFKFYKSIISHSSFYGLNLKEIVIEECIARDCDFRMADLTKSSFKSTDLELSQFVHSNLSASNFTDAFNYQINPTENNIRKAKFSLPDALHLLDSFEIEIL